MSRTLLLRSTLWVLAIAYLLALVVACLLPVAYLPPANLSDKLEHLLAFALLALLFRALYPHRFWQAVLAAVAVGGLIEIAQGLSGYRHAEMLDWLADSAGALLGSLLASAARHCYSACGLPLWWQKAQS